MNILIVGSGSIGKRHENILQTLGHQVSIVSRHREHAYPTLTQAFNEKLFDYVVVANETNLHEDILDELGKYHFNGNVLIEKPLFGAMPKKELTINHYFVGYNLRFHPIIQFLKVNLLEDAISVQAYVGQYLPTWRPGSNYKQSYSAKKSLGGGVLRDLSHELDYLQFLFGEWSSLTALGGNFSDLSIDSDDHFSLLFQTKQTPLISVQLNYLDHLTQRFLIVNTNTTTYKADFIANTLEINGDVQHFRVEKDDTYRNQHIALLNNETKFLCTYEQGLRIVKMMEFVEKACHERVWVNNG